MTLPVSPSGKIYKSSNNLKERIHIYNYIRNSLIKISDGEYINLDDNYSKEAKNLMSYIKVLNLNPYGKNLNPYKDLPENFMIYNSGFPLIKKENSNTIDLNKDNVGLNLRIYGIDVQDIGPVLTFKFDVKQNDNNFLSTKLNDDIYFYNYVKNKILLKNICPHFALIYAYFVSTGKNKNLKKLFKNNYDNLISLKRDRFFKENKINHNSIFTEFEKIHYENLIKSANEHFKRYNEPIIKYHFFKLDIDKNRNIYKLLIYENEDIKNNLLVALTEAPNINFKDWYTNSYVYKDLKQRVKIMSNNGYHNNDVWYTILFQLYYTLMIMIIEDIYIGEFNIQNIFIKNLSDNEKINGYWIYKIYGTKFYIKNYGFLLIIDSNFKNTQIKINTNENKNNFSNMKNLFNSLMSDEIMNEDVTNFILEIHNSLDMIDSDTNENFQKETIKSFLVLNLFNLFANKFLHNKIGDEIDQNLQIKNKIPSSGDIIDDGGKYSIFLKMNDNKYIIKRDNIENLEEDQNYNIYCNLEQKLLDDGSKFDLKNLLDTYVLN